MDRALDDFADRSMAQFVSRVEKELLPKCVASKKILGDGSKNIEDLEQHLIKLSKKIDSIGYSFFAVTSHGSDDGLKPAENALEESKNQLSGITRSLEVLKTKKSEDLTLLAESNAKFDALKEQLKTIEIEMESVKNSKDSDLYRILAQLMQTKFQLSKELCCVSLIMDEENHRVKGTIRVDKENHPEEELRSNIWSKYYRLY